MSFQARLNAILRAFQNMKQKHIRGMLSFVFYFVVDHTGLMVFCEDMKSLGLCNPGFINALIFLNYVNGALDVSWATQE